MKHGAFTKTTILPGEDPAEFEELHFSLIEEWKPVGPTEEDAILSIAQAVWRKRRAQKLLQAQIERCRFDPKHPLYDERQKILKLFSILESAPFVGFVDTAPEIFDKFYEPLARALLSYDQRKYLEEKFPRESFKSGSAWLEAVHNEIASALLPFYELVGESPDALLGRAAEFFTPELSKQELAVDERIDVMIDRAIKRLVQTKAMKQVLRRTSPVGEDDQPKKFQSGKPGGSAKVINYKGRSGE